LRQIVRAIGGPAGRYPGAEADRQVEYRTDNGAEKDPLHEKRPLFFVPERVANWLRRIKRQYSGLQAGTTMPAHSRLEAKKLAAAAAREVELIASL